MTTTKFIHRRIAVLGCGNLGTAIARGIVAAKIASAQDVVLTKRTHASLAPFKNEGFSVTVDVTEAVKDCKILIIGVLPNYVYPLLDQIKSHVTDEHLIISVVSGFEIADIKRRLESDTVSVVRAMPNTAIAQRESMTCIAGEDRNSGCVTVTKEIFDALGTTMVVDEPQIIPATAICACGIAFFCRAIRAASQAGTEIGFHSDEAIKLAAQTAKGAATMLLATGLHPELAIDKVTTPLGCTITGLNTMEHNGYSSAIIKGIVGAAEKADKQYQDKKANASKK